MARAAGLETLEGYRPPEGGGASGVRFGCGVFIDVHATPPGARTGMLVGLAGGVDAAAALARDRGWRVRIDRRSDAPRLCDAPPWSVLSFRGDQGILSALFVIEHHPGAPTSSVYAQPLYSKEPAPRNDPRVAAAWFEVRDVAAAADVLAAFGATPTGQARSAWAPFAGARWRLGEVDLILATAPSHGTDGLRRLDVRGPLGLPASVHLLKDPLFVVHVGAATKG